MIQWRFGLIIWLAVLYLFGCSSPSKNAPDTEITPAQLNAIDTTFHKVNVNNLRVRTQPDLNANTVTLLKEGVIVKAWGERSQKKIEINLRGVNISDYWYKIKYGAHSGWVFGGALLDIEQVPEGDFLIIPGKRVGPILENDNEASLINRLGKTLVKRDSVFIGEGEKLVVSVIFSGEDSELTIFWEEQDFDNIYEIRIENENSPWKTEENIRIGTSLREIQQINKVPFMVSGFEWNYAGTAMDWKSGEISDQLALIFETPDDPHASLLGDHSIPSDNRYLRRSNPKVKTIRVLFSE